MTDAEQALWRRINRRQMEGVKFRRQQVLGPYIVDFVCLDKRLVVEIDGGQHAEQRARDDARTGWLRSQGFEVLRFWNNEVLGNMGGVLQVIMEALCGREAFHPHPGLPPSRGKE
jgi:very-short-patch-repair endonuclease